MVFFVFAKKETIFTDHFLTITIIKNCLRVINVFIQYLYLF